MKSLSRVRYLFLATLGSQACCQQVHPEETLAAPHYFVRMVCRREGETSGCITRFEADAGIPQTVKLSTMRDDPELEATIRFHPCPLTRAPGPNFPAVLACLTVRHRDMVHDEPQIVLVEGKTGNLEITVKAPLWGSVIRGVCPLMHDADVLVPPDILHVEFVVRRRSQQEESHD